MIVSAFGMGGYGEDFKAPLHLSQRSTGSFETVGSGRIRAPREAACTRLPNTDNIGK